MQHLLLVILILKSQWTIAQQTCFYDIATSNDTTLGQASAVASEELAQITVDQRYPPEFNANLPLTLTVNESSSVSIDFTATSPYTSSIIYELVQGPSSASFNNQTAQFTWQKAITSQSSVIVRVTAKDAQYELLSTHDLALNVRPRAMPPPPSSSSLFKLSWIFLLMNIFGTFFFCRQ